MANQKQLALLRQGVEQWNRWRKQRLPPAPLPELLARSERKRRADIEKIRPDLRGADLYRADLSGADLTQTSLDGADLSHAFLQGANLGFAHLEAANLENAYLKEADLRGADLSGANLTRADLTEANLRGATLREGRLIGAEIVSANLSGADLQQADLSYANLFDTNLSDAKFRGANLEGTRVWDAIFARVDLREVKGLSEIFYQASFAVALYTIQLPQNEGALHFLRGAGMPDEYIDLWRSTVLYPIQYHSCFISYSSKDGQLAHRLHSHLQDYGVRCWFAPEDMKIGDKIRSRIDQAIHVHEKLLLLLSEHALASSWVEDEVEAAFAKEREQKREILFPVRLDDAVMHTSQAWAKKLRDTRHIGDFTNWTDPQAYQRTFERLLRDLKKVDGQQDQETSSE